jgi:tetratricopeptide (TPR) repeat protein
VLLLPAEIPSETMTLQLAREDKFESGPGFALIGLAGRDKTNLHIPEDVRIDGKIADHRNSKGLRQFSGLSDITYWSGRGSSGSPVFLEHGQQLAGILSRSELGANEGASPLHEAFVVPATTVRPFLVGLTTRETAKTQQIPVDQLQPILEMVGAQDIPIAEIPNRIRQFVQATQAHAAEPVHSSNDGADIEAVIAASREKLSGLDTAGARALLQAKINDEEGVRTRRLIPLLKERAAIERLAFDHEVAKTTLAEIIRLSPDDVWSHIHLGDLWQITGNLDNAAEAYRGAENAARRTANDRDLSVSHNKIGDVLKSQGDRRGALAAYRASHTIREALARRDPTNAGWQRDLSVNHDRVGDVLISQGDHDGALAAYRAGHGIADTLTLRDPTNIEWQRDLSVSHNKIGDVLTSQGDHDGALGAYRASLAIREKLAHSDPANTEWQRDLSVSHERIGNVLTSQGDPDGALAAHRASLTIREALAHRDPANTEWQRDFSISHSNIGDVLGSRGDRDGALAAYRASLAIRETLARRDPANTEWQHDLSVNHTNIGDLLGSRGDHDGALAAYRASLAIDETLARRDPANTEWQRDLIISLKNLAETEPSEALLSLSRALEIARALQSADRLAPTDTGIIDDLTQRISDLAKKQNSRRPST